MDEFMHDALEHYHDHEDEGPGHSHGPSLPPPQDVFSLTSVGVDIGSTTSHLVVSRLVLVRQGLALSSGFKTVQRDIVYSSPIILTPFSDGTSIDADYLSRFIASSYEEAGITPEDIDTGAVIVTGQAATKENAASVASLFSQQVGKFVCATAGPNLEAILAAHGSGAVALSARDGTNAVMNIDVGGGTTKVSITSQGQVLDTAAMNVGARLVAFDESGSLVRIEAPAHLLARECGFALRLGDSLPEQAQRGMVDAMVSALCTLVSRQELTPLARELMITPVLGYAGPLGAMVFSGGVSEYVYGYESRGFGDLGNLLGRGLHSMARAVGVPVHEPIQRIRATVIGAGQYTLQVSGSTIHLTRPGLLPIRNLPVVSPVLLEDGLDSGAVAEAVAKSFQRRDMDPAEQAVALSIHWKGEPSYPMLRALAEGLVRGVGPGNHRTGPLVLVFDADIGGAVGHVIAQEIAPGLEIVSIDELQLGELDYIDIGAYREEQSAVPVVVKSLVFG